MMRIRSRAIKSTMIVIMSAVLGATALYGCGGQSAPTPTVASAPPTATTASEAAPTTEGGSTGSIDCTQPNDPEALSLMQATSRAMQALKSVHLALEIEGAAGSISGEGDIQLPYSMRLNLTTPEGTSEQLVVGGKMYMKVPDSDAYVALPSNPAILVIAASLMNMDAYVQNAQGATLVGDEQVGGVETKHVKFCYDADAVAATFFQSQGLPTPEPSSGDATLATGDIWVDRGSNYVRQYKFEVGSGADRQTTSLTLSKYNEPVSPPIEEPTNVQQLPDLLTPSP